MNLLLILLVREGKKITIDSMNIVPGDILYCKKGDKYPVDSILISSAYEEGTVFVDTAELDGYNNSS